MKILIAEDDVVTRKMLASLLTRWDFAVTTVGTGTEAWEMLQAEDAPNLVLLDWQMPGLDGVDICRLLREKSALRHKYLILLTSRSETEDVISGLEAGADDYLTKPFDKGELLARISVGRRTLLLQQELALSLQTIEDTMQRLQSNFLWGQKLADMDGCSTAIESISYGKADGDFYEFYRMSPTQFDLVVGDVMGKGMIAALLGAAATHSMTRAFSDLMITSHDHARPTPQSLVQHLSERISPELYDMDSFITLFYCRFDLNVMKMTFVGCGHPSPMIYNYRTQTHRQLNGQNTPIGFIKHDQLIEATLPIEAGDVILFCSDGITEARNTEWELYGDRRLSALLERTAGKSPKDILVALNNDCREFVGDIGFSDDATCIVVQVE